MYYTTSSSLLALILYYGAKTGDASSYIWYRPLVHEWVITKRPSTEEDFTNHDFVFCDSFSDDEDVTQCKEWRVPDFQSNEHVVDDNLKLGSGDCSLFKTKSDDDGGSVLINIGSLHLFGIVFFVLLYVLL